MGLPGLWFIHVHPSTGPILCVNGGGRKEIGPSTHDLDSEGHGLSNFLNWGWHALARPGTLFFHLYS